MLEPRLLLAAPYVSIYGDSGAVYDNVTGRFGWSVYDRDYDLATVDVSITRNGSEIASYSSYYGSHYVYPADGLGDYAIFVGARDAMNNYRSKSESFTLYDDDTGSPSTDDSGGGDPIEDGDGDGDGGGCGCATGPSGGAAWLALIALVGGLRRRD